MSIISTSLYELYSVAIPEHFESFALKNYIDFVAPTFDLQRVSIYNKTEFLYYSSTIKLFLFLILIKWSYLSFMTLLLYQGVILNLVAVVARKSMQDITRIGTSN